MAENICCPLVTTIGKVVLPDFIFADGNFRFERVPQVLLASQRRLELAILRRQPTDVGLRSTLNVDGEFFDLLGDFLDSVAFDAGATETAVGERRIVQVELATFVQLAAMFCKLLFFYRHQRRSGQKANVCPG